MSQRRSDEMNLSLTGSQISARSSSSSRLRAGGTKTPTSGPNRISKTSIDSGKVIGSKKDSLKDHSQPNSSRSLASSVASRTSTKRTTNGSSASHRDDKEDELLSFFESASQGNRQTLSRANSGASKKQSTNSNKKEWLGPKHKLPSKKPAWALTKLEQKADSARSDEPYNIFHRVSARTSDGEDDNEDLPHSKKNNSVSQSNNKSHSVQQKFSGSSNRNSNALKQDLYLDSARTDSTLSNHTIAPEDSVSAKCSPKDMSVDDFIEGVIKQTSLNNKLDKASNRDEPVLSPALANNVSCPTQKQKTKVSLSSMENSYQNIKPKIPVNQVKSPQNQNVLTNKSTPSVSKSSTAASRKSQNMVEDYITALNDAATKIQTWFRRHQVRRNAGTAAMRRLLSQKKQEIEANMSGDLTQPILSQEERAAERKRIREEKAKEARQQAIKELQKKREERKNDVKKIAEEEISFLQSNGKITKSPSTSSLSHKKKASPRHSRSNTPATGANPSQEVVSPSPTPGDEEVPGKYFQSGATGEEKDGPAHSKSVFSTEVLTQSQGRTTLEDLYSTLKKLEEEENLLSARTPKKNYSWLDSLEKDVEESQDTGLTAENLQRLSSNKDANKDTLSKSGFLTNDKLKSIINFLDDVQVSDRLSEIDTEISRMNEEMVKPALLVPSGEEVVHMEQAQAAASEVTSAMLSQRLELDEKKRTVTMLQKALNQQRELTVRHARETEKEMSSRLDVQKDEYEETIKRHLSFIDQLIDDKKNLGEKCEKLVMELKTVDKKYQDKIKSLDENHTLENSKLKEMHSAAEKLRRERWIEDKTKKIKEMTVKGLEPEIQRLIAKHKSDVKKIKQIHEAELLESDERAAQKYVKMTEELRDQLATEKEAACTRERELSKQRYEKQLQQEEEAYQQHRRRLYQEVQEEKDRVASSSSRQKAELERLQRQLEDTHRHALESMREEFDKSRQEQETRHKTEVKHLHEKLKLEKESWEENYMKRHETWLVQKERELRDQVKKERDKEIELVIERLEEEATKAREDGERTTDQKTRRMREKYDIETRELEQSERKAVQKYNEIKAKMTEVEGENERLKVIVRQKEQEIFDGKKLIEKMNSERSHVSDIIRQEFADRIVTTDEENKRIKHEISELKARQRLEIEKMERRMEELRVAKDEEMEEVHKRVKQAIVKKEEVVSQLKQQYQAANKRADHLEGLLEQQRKQLLKK